MGALMELLPLGISMVMGAGLELWKQSMANKAANHEMMLRGMAASDKSFGEARKYDSPHASFLRKFIVIVVISSLFLFPMLVTFLNWFGSIAVLDYSPITTYVPKEMFTGGLFSTFWQNKETIYVPIEGFILMPIHALMATTITGFYFGQGGARLRSR